MKKLQFYLRVWLFFARHELQQVLIHPVSGLLFFLGKTVRFVMLLAVLLSIKQTTRSLVGYSIDEIVIFYLVFSLIDVVSQLFLRGAYFFYNEIRSGSFDTFLLQPVPALMRSLMTHPDFNDLITLVPLSAYFLWFITDSSIALSMNSVLSFLLLFVNGILIAFSLHVLVLCLGIVTVEVENAIMMYRDLSQLGRFPIEIYREPIRWITTFIFPITIMVNFPARALLGEDAMPLILTSTLIAILFVFISLITWKFALRQYTSASS